MAELEPALVRVETQLDALTRALGSQDSALLDSAAASLREALAAALDSFRRAARQGEIPAPLRHRLAAAGAQIAAQREALARATTALDRAIEVLIPSAPAGNATYGGASRLASTGSMVA